MEYDALFSVSIFLYSYVVFLSFNNHSLVFVFRVAGKHRVMLSYLSTAIQCNRAIDKYLYYHYKNSIT